MSFLSGFIRSRIAGQAIDADAERNLVHLIVDALPPDPEVAAVELAISHARQGYGALFQKEPEPPVDTRPRVLSTVGGVYKRKKPA